MLGQAKAFVKSLLDVRHRKKRADELRATRRLITKDDLRVGLESLGIRAGDAVMLHSSLKSIGFVDGGPRTVLESLVEAVGPTGTLVVPTYWLPGGTILETCRLEGYVFDPRRDGSNLGRLPSEFLTFDGIARSIHPTHSVSAIGRDARHVVEDHHRAPSIFGTGSPWDRCHALDAKVVGLGISMGPVTFYHLLEDRLLDRFPLPVRMTETYRLPCIDWDGAPRRGAGHAARPDLHAASDRCAGSRRPARLVPSRLRRERTARVGPGRRREVVGDPGAALLRASRSAGRGGHHDLRDARTAECTPAAASRGAMTTKVTDRR